MKGKVAAVYCEFKYSGVASILPLALSAATVAVVLATPLDVPLRWAIAGWIAAISLRAQARIRAVRALRFDGIRALQVMYAGGSEISGAVRPGSFVSPWLTLVRWRPEGAWLDRTLLVLPGMAGRDEFRRMRLLLRWN
jgi:hypothetical protein